MGERQQQPIPFLNAQQSGYEELGGASPIAMNVVARGQTVRRRPGLAAWSKATSAVIDADGVFALRVTSSGDLYAIAGTSPTRHVYFVTAGGSLDLSNITDGDIRGNERPVLVETESILAITAGDRAHKVVLSTKIPSPLANAPMGKYVTAHAYRLLIDDPDTTTLVDYSGLSSGPADFTGFETWGTGVGTAGFIQVNAHPSSVVALGSNSNEVFAWTKRSMQVFSPDASSDYVPAVTREVGCAAPYSVIKSDEQFAWLDHLRRFSMSDGREVVPISTGIQQTLNDMTTVDDCYGYRFMEGDIDVLVWTFPTEGRTFAYQKAIGWSQWSTRGASNWAPWTVLSHEFTEGTNIVGTTDGRILELTTRNTEDLGDPIPAYIVTGFLDRGSPNRKTCKCVRLTLRRGQTTGDDEPVALLAWRDDLGPFGPPITIGLGAAGETAPVVEFYGLGVYRRRQWKFTFTGSEELELVSAIEDYEVQGN